MLLASAVTVSASSQKATGNNLAKYLERVQLAETSVPTHTLGSAWSDNGRMASLTSDYKARSAGDLITILVVHDLSSSSTGAHVLRSFPGWSAQRRRTCLRRG